MIVKFIKMILSYIWDYAKYLYLPLIKGLAICILEIVL